MAHPSPPAGASPPDNSGMRPGKPGMRPSLVTPTGLRLGSVFGAPVYIAPSWLIFLAWVTIAFAPLVADSISGIGSARYAVALTFGLSLGLSVLLHEIAHCAAARVVDVPVQRVILTWLAGHSALEREPDTPKRMVLVAVAGPIVNIVLAMLAWLGARQLPADSVGWVLTAGLAWTNGLVGIYNLLPGLPLDGGQILRALIWAVTRNARTGVVGAAWAGRVLGVATGAFGVALIVHSGSAGETAGLWTLFIAAMILISSTSILRQQTLRDRLPALTARGLTRRALPVPADLPLSEAVRRAHESNAGGLVIVDGDGRPTGVVNEAAVTATPPARRPWVSIGSVSRGIDATQFVPLHLAGEDLLRRLQEAPASEYVVIEPDGSVYGVLAAADVSAALKA